MKEKLFESDLEEKVLSALKNVIRGSEWNGKIYLVGGAVRDIIMGKDAKDLDFVVDGDLNAGIQFSEWLANKLGIYRSGSNPVIYPRFGTSKLSLNGNNLDLPNIELEFVAPRTEKYNNNSRKPEVGNGTLKDDSFRRDLTINALMKNVSTDEILDLTGYGINDIKNGIIRTTSDPGFIFGEDPLRMMRVVRFAVKYGFKITDDIVPALKKCAHLINNISSERINDELNKILLSPNPSKGIEMLKDVGILSHIMPEFNDAVGMEQNAYHKDDVFGHTMNVLANTPPELKTRLMALFHDIGKVLTKSVTPDGSVHFYDHENAGVDVVKNIMTRLKYPNELINSVTLGVQNHMRLKGGGKDGKDVSDKTLRKFRTAVGEHLEDILDLIHADNISHADESSMPEQIKNIRSRLSNLNDNLENNRPRLPINGNDLIKMGFKPSPLMKDVLAAVEDAWFENPNLTKDDAIKIAETFLVQEMKNNFVKIISL